MAETVCYTPSGLARSINQLPFPGFAAAAGNLLGDGVVSAVLGNSTSRAVFWGCFIIILTVFFMILTTIFYCCLYCLRKRCNRSSMALKLGCGGCSIVLILVCLAIIGVAYWAETTLDREFTVSSDGTGTVLGSNATFETFVNAQRIRHWVVIGFLVVIILVLLLVILAVILSPVCKGNTTFLKIMLAVLGVIIVLTAVIAGLIFTITIIHGDLCVTTNDLFEQVVDGSLCRDSDNSVQSPQNQRFSGLLCQASAGELYDLISSGSRCEDWWPFKLLDTLGSTNFCQINISQLYQRLFQPLTSYCEEELFCRTPVETLTSVFLEVDNCMFAPFLCDIRIGGLVNVVVRFIIRRVCQDCESIGDLIENFGSNTCVSPDSDILIKTLCRLPLGDNICPTLCQSTIDELLDNSPICQQQVEDYCSIIDSSICTDQPLLMRLGLSTLINYVNIFCNDALSSEFLLLIMVCVLIIALIIVQVAAAIYTTSFSADDSDSDYNSSGTGVTLKMKIFGRGGQAI